MLVSEFEQQLNLHAPTNGGNFLKADFHIHAPGSTDYEHKGRDALERLGEIIRLEDYAFAVILEHQRMPDRGVLNDLHKHCPKTRLIPGAEINVYVDAMFKQVSKDYFFHCIVAVDPYQSMDYNYALERAKQAFTYDDRRDPEGFTSSIVDIGKFFIKEGALFIPAHLHQSKRPETSRSIDDIYDDDSFLGFVEASVFSALEVREVATAAFFTGDRKTARGSEIPAAVCVRSSDAHHHEHIRERNRFTWVKSEENSFQELKAALSFSDRITLSDPQVRHSRVIGLHVSGQFLRDEWISFNSSMNCLIGCKGTGKTAILECLRFVLGTYIPDDRKDTVSKHLDYILGASGFVECLVQRGDGVRAILLRRADSPGRLRVIEADGTSRDVETLDQASFEVSILGWHEIEVVAEDPASRISLIDRVSREAEIRALYKTIDSKVEAARDHLPTFQRRIKKLDEKLKKRQTLRERRNTLKRLKEGALLDLQTQYEKFLFCEQQLESLKDRLAKVPGQIESDIDSAFSHLSDEFEEPNRYPEDIQDIIAAAKSRFKNLVTTKSKGKEHFRVNLESAKDETSKNLGEGKSRFLRFREDYYNPKVNALPPDEREILSRQIQVIEETKKLPELESECRSLESDVRKIAGTIYAICDDTCNTRNRVCELRAKEVDLINAEVPSVQLRFLRSADRTKRTRYQKDYGKDAAQYINYVDTYGQTDAYENLRKLFGEFKDIDTEKNDFELKDLLLDAKFIDFMKVVDDDDIEISLVLEPGKAVPIQNLSAGQQCTAVFPLLLRIKKGPLVIDQPEDNLDNRHIADVIAPQLLEKKISQQFILTSHNANLVVLTDAELIMHTDTEGSEGKIVDRGFLACAESKIKDAVVNVLDGGEAALLARQRKYGIGTSLTN